MALRRIQRFPILRFRSKETFEPWGFEVPIRHRDAQPLQLEPSGNVSQSHRAPDASFVGVKRNDHLIALTQVRRSLARFGASPETRRRSENVTLDVLAIGDVPGALR